jgi:hypothetical protein
MVRKLLVKKYVIIILLVLELYFVIVLFKLPVRLITTIPAGLSVIVLPITITLLLRAYGGLASGFLILEYGLHG